MLMWYGLPLLAVAVHCWITMIIVPSYLFLSPALDASKLITLLILPHLCRGDDHASPFHFHSYILKARVLVVRTPQIIWTLRKILI